MNAQIKDGGPAYPQMHFYKDGSPGLQEGQERGMTLRQYAAIKLRVLESGNEWLDEIIRKSLRDEFAAKAMQGLLADPTSDQLFVDMADMAKVAYRAADAMLRAREVQP